MIMPFEGTHYESPEDAALDPQTILDAEHAYCPEGCPTEDDCCHAPLDADDDDFEAQREADYDPDGPYEPSDRECDHAENLATRAYYGDH